MNEAFEKGDVLFNKGDYIAEAAEKDALKRGSTVVIAGVGDEGQLLVLERLGHTQVASVGVAIGKARDSVDRFTMLYTRCDRPHRCETIRPRLEPQSIFSNPAGSAARQHSTLKRILAGIESEP